MAQLNFQTNFFARNVLQSGISNGTLSFFAFNVFDSISFVALNLLVRASSAADKTITMSAGLYSLTGNTLSIANSISGSMTLLEGARNQYISMTGASANQNITPGTWYFGILVSTSGNSAISFFGQSINPANAFPGGFFQGRMSASTNALPGSYATSDLDVTGGDAMQVPMIILTA